MDKMFDVVIQRLSALDADSRRGLLLKLLDSLDDHDIRFLHKCILKKGFPGSFNSSKSIDTPRLSSTYLPDTVLFKFTNLDPFQEIADEIVVHILSYLHDPKTLSACARVNKRFYRTLSDNILWRKVCGNASFAPIHPVSISSSSNFQRIRQSSSNHSLNALSNSSTTRSIFSHTSLFNSTSSLSSPRSPLFSRRIPRPPSLAPWKKVFKDNYLTLVNWMQGRYTVEPVTHVQQHGQLCLQFNHQRAISVSVGQAGRVWDVNTGRAYFTLEGHNGAISTAQISDRYIITASTDRTVKVWNMETGLCEMTLSGPSEEICSVSYSAPYIAAGSEDYCIYVWNLETQSSVGVLSGHSGAVTAIETKDGIIVSGSTDSSVRIWRQRPEIMSCLSASRPIPNLFQHIKTLTGHSGTVFCVQFDSRYICSGSEDTTIMIWRRSDLKLHKRLQGHHLGVVCLQFDETKLVSGSADNTIRVWDLKTGHSMYILKQHHGTIWNLKFNHTQLISSSLDQSVLIWNFASPHNSATTQDDLMDDVQ